MKKMFLAGIAGLLLGVALCFVFLVRQNPETNLTVEASQSTTTQTAAVVENTLDSSAAGTQSEEDNDREEAVVEVPMEQIRTMGIKTAAVAAAPMRKKFRTTGRIEVDERKLTTVNIKVDGWIDKLYADYTGKYVAKGAPLADIYSQELMSVQLEYINLLNWKSSLGLRTQRNIEFSLGDRYGFVGRLTMYDLDPLFDVAKQKLALWDMSEDEMKQIEQNRTPIRTMTIKSPVSGYIFQKPVFKGTRVAQGDKIVDIADLSTVWVLADIYEQEASYVKAGQKARITLGSYPGKEFTAKVDFVYPSFSGQTRTAKARFVLPNPDLLLKPQMFANVEMEIDLGERLSIPETAVLDTGTKQVVYVDLGQGFFAPRQIKAGERAGGMVEIINGLKAGEKVASSAVFLIDSEAKLKGVGDGE